MGAVRALAITGLVLVAWAEQGRSQGLAPTVDWNSFYYGRAVDCWMNGDMRGAAEQLEHIDVTPASTFAHADQAAFLLATAYLRLGDARAFERVAIRAGSESGSPYRRWIRYCALAEAARRSPVSGAAQPVAPAGFAGGDILEAALLFESGNAPAAQSLLQSSPSGDELASIHLYVRALAKRATGGNPASDWEALLQRKPRHPLEADLIGRAAIELAALRVAQPERAAQALESAPRESRYYPRALQLRALLAVESGDTAAASVILRTLQEDHPTADGRRDTQLALGGMMMNRGHWYAALRYFESAADSWDDESTAIDHLDSPDDLAAVWSVWRSRENWNDEIRLAPEALLAMVTEAAGESLPAGSAAPVAADDRVAAGFWPVAAPQSTTTLPWDSTHALAHHTPTRDEWERVRAIERAAAEQRSALAHEDHLLAERTAELERMERYLARGAGAADESADTLSVTIARLTALISRLDAALADLAGVRDGALKHVATRTRDMVTQLREEVVFMRAIRHFHVDGPQRDRPEQFPAGTPSPAELLAREEALALQADQFLEFFAAHYANVIRLSFDRSWRPHLVDNSKRLRTQLQAELTRSRRIGASIDSSLAGLARDSEIAAIEKRRARLLASTDSLGIADLKTRREIAAAVATRAQAQLVVEREAIDYHLADATYELAVQAATDSATAENAEIVTPLRDRAIERVTVFLSQYPKSAARSESRYRLADLELMRAREDFRTRMAGFLGSTPSSQEIQNRDLAPFVNYAPAIEQYEAILREDPAYAHLDAVLFNLGMILADDGRPEAMQHLARLVAEYPSSPDVQEAWLRMGSDRFDRRDYAGAAPLLDHAATGHDPSFTAMALYKLGWSRFEVEQFDAATDAFARLIDHYDRHAEIARKMDLRQEAEECLVHTLARSGGASAFAAYFDRAGRRDYESRVLTSLASLLRGSSLYSDAIECEKLWLARYPNDPAAFTAAERLVDTYQRWNKPELAREAKRSHAEHFLPGSPWHRAQKDESARAAAAEFARSGYREAAAFRHAQARKSNDPAQWRDALKQYEIYLSHWPSVNDSPRLHLLASDVAVHMNDYPSALKHLSATMTSDSLPLVLDAAWQRVAVTDTWYRKSQPAAPGATKTAGSDSLATLVLKTGDEFTSRFSRDPRCADIAWRQGNVALAHGWYADAATRLDRFGQQYAGDKRALPAVVRSADARYRLKEYESAGATYEKALVMARTAKRDSLATALETTIPTCYYQQAETVAGADKKDGERKAAPLFARVARSWPRFKHADLALYRAGLGFAADKKYSEATGAWQELLRVYPKSEYARDSAAQIAVTEDAAGNKIGAAAAYEQFAAMYPKDADAPEALLKAADLRIAAGDEAGAEKTRSRFLAEFPGEVAAGMEIRSARAQKELAAATKGNAPISSLLSKGSTSELKAYLVLAEKNPELASPEILAQCDFLKAEEAHTSYVAIKLTQPLPKSLEKKKASLESMVALYNGCSERGIAEYTRASAHRIGQSLIEFGEALQKSERPKDMSEEDLLAYNDVLTEQSYEFFDRGEDAWSTLLRQSKGETDDPGRWLARTRDVLWPRLGERFLFRPEVDYPLLRATAPAPAAVP